MQKMQSLNIELFKTLETEEMNSVNGGKLYQQDPTKAIDCCTMTGNGTGKPGSHWDGEDPYTD
jgi:bacteriocin-like protein